MGNQVSIYLFGGNSKIGKSILNGVIDRYSDHSIRTVLIKRTKQKKPIDSEVLIVNNYSEALNVLNIKRDVINIFILSFVVLRPDDDHIEFIDNLKFHLNINTHETFNIGKEIIMYENYTELHIVSSILADFVRPTLKSYSLSKIYMNELIQKLISPKNKEKIFIWKPAFVDSNLNKDRTPSFLKTNSTQIRRYVFQNKLGGTYYIPFYSSYLTFLAKKISFLVNIIDKRSKKY